MKYQMISLVAAVFASVVSASCFAADRSMGWSELQKIIAQAEQQKISFHVESALGRANSYSLDYSSAQAEQLELLTRHALPEPVPLVRFGFKQTGTNSDAAKITQRMLQSLVTNGTISLTFTW